MNSVMRCTAFCTANSYDLHTLASLLDHEDHIHLFRDVMHITLLNKDIFFFSFGVTIFWNLDTKEEDKILHLIQKAELQSVPTIEREKYSFSYGRTPSIQRDLITLANRKKEPKLAISYALAQSVKLSAFERLIDTSIDKTKYLPERVATTGSIALSRKEMAQMIGRLFIDRSSVNLHSDILDEPEYFWEYPQHHHLYLKMTKTLSIGTRVEVLNTRLGILHELLQMLSNQLDHQHSSALEWTIIALIFIEISLALLKDLFHIL